MLVIEANNQARGPFMSRALKLSLKTAFLAAVLLLGACASRDMNYVEMNALMPAAPADKGRIYFYRESAWLGNLVTPDVVLGREIVGMSNPGAFFYVDRAPGEYTVFCGMGDQHSASFSLAAGEEVYVRTSVASGVLAAHMNTEVVGSSEAIPALRHLSYVAIK
jgi:hypothetical protein